MALNSTASRASFLTTRHPSRLPFHFRHSRFPMPVPLPRSSRKFVVMRVNTEGGGDSYLDMWKKAVDKGWKEVEFQVIAENREEEGEGNEDNNAAVEDEVLLEKKSSEFEKILEASTEERDRIQRMQVIDRAAAAIAAAKALLKGKKSDEEEVKLVEVSETVQEEDSGIFISGGAGKQNDSLVVSQSVAPSGTTPGPDFWSWAPPPESDEIDDVSNTPAVQKPSVFPISFKPVMEKERSMDYMSIPFQTKSEKTSIPLPPLQSIVEVEKVETLDPPVVQEEHEIGVQFSTHAAQAAQALENAVEASSHGVYPDGSRWWKETGIEQRPNGVICRWTLTRGVSADQEVEWEEKFWEAADEFLHKELGSEKSGRDARGNVWREYWKETMWEDSGLMHIEKLADKWGKNGQGDEWQEEWWEQYDASGKAEKWAHKWCSIDPTTPVEIGHAHIWHERWGEKYDGLGGSMKYTDKWAERCEGDGWTKWGDKWDENFDLNSQGVKQGETWWEGKYGERWNRTWGEGHNGSGWVHKYGKSSSGEHWDTHEPQETWYERYPHFGFMHCFDNSVQLREVRKPSEHETS